MTDVFIGRMFFRKVSEKIAEKLVNTPITPNECTAVSFVLALVASVCFFMGQWSFLVLGAIILYFSELFDFIDGDLARAKGMVSKYGALFDGVSDTCKKPMIIFSATIGLFFLTQEVSILFLGIFAMCCIYFMEVSKHLIEAMIGKTAAVSAPNGVVFGFLDTMVVVVLFAALFNQMLLALITITVLTFVVSIMRVFEVYQIVWKKGDLKSCK